MIDDLAQSSTDIPALDADVCIAGGGVAGLTLASRLDAAGYRVVVIEAGGRDVSAAAQDAYAGETVGTENLPLRETRLSALGGSSNHWGGWCRPLDAVDFARRDFSPDGTWPIGQQDLAPYLDEARALLDIDETSGADLDLVDAGGRLQTIEMQFSVPPARLGEKFWRSLSASRNVRVILHAVLVGCACDRATGRVLSFGVSTVAGTRRLECRARLFVLAMGAIENARFLAIENRRYDDRLGNRGGAVGRSYMQHLHQVLGGFVLLGDAPSAPIVGPAQRAFFSSTPALLRETGTGAFRLYTGALACPPLGPELLRVARGAACRSVAAEGAVLVTAEQLPDADNRIELGDARDGLDRPRVRLRWTVTERDRQTLQVAAWEFGRYLIAAKIGRLKVNAAILSGADPVAGWTRLASAPGAAGHQLGGARMSRTADDGVVDRDCRVWGTENLFVAGAAVFRTGGHANPTLTIVQLGLRLARHLERLLAA